MCSIHKNSYCATLEGINQLIMILPNEMLRSSLLKLVCRQQHINMHVKHQEQELTQAYHTHQAPYANTFLSLFSSK